MFFSPFPSKREYDTRANSRRFRTWTGAAEQTCVVSQLDALRYTMSVRGKNVNRVFLAEK